ncbi:MAG: hypothetical protein LBV41_12895 [Cytophagaceae bacterium]|jgi:hypothetical protein|nr:hypothetical protein [Cytophagaceae bacterium]
MKTDKQPAYLAQIIEIADFMFKHPDKKMSDVVSYFVKKCQKNDRTVNRYIKKAKEYNKSRILRQEKVKNDILIKQAKESAKSVILSRNEALEILSDIASGKKRKDSDRTRAIQQLAKMEGWDAPEQHEIVDTIKIKYKGFEP